MRNGTAWTGCVLVLIGLWLSGQKPIQAQTMDKSVFADDARLLQKVRLHAEGVPIADLLQQLSAKTGVVLKAASDVTDEKVVLFGPPRPLRNTLEDLAALFNNNWLRSEPKKGEKPKYTLYRSRRNQEAEAALVAYKKIQMLKSLAAQVDALRESPAQLQKRKEDDPIRIALSNPVNRMATEFFALLSTQQREQLFQNGSLPAVPLKTLPPARQNALRGMALKGSLEEYDSMASTAANAPKPEDPQPPLVAADIARLKEQAQKQTLEMLTTANVSWEFDEEANGLQLNVGSYSTDLGIPRPEDAPFQQGNPYTGKPNPKKLALPEALDLPAVQKIPKWVDRLRTLAEATGRPVLSDYYRLLAAAEDKPLLRRNFRASGDDGEGDMVMEGDPVEAGSAVPAESGEKTKPEPENAPPPPPAEPPGPLDSLCSEQHYWWLRGETLLFRAEKWYEKNLEEPPDGWVRNMARLMHSRKGVPSYSDVADLTRLTPRQLGGLTETYSTGVESDTPLFAGGDTVADNPQTQRSLHRFLALLPAAVPNAGQSLPRGDFPLLEQMRWQMEALAQIKPEEMASDKPPAAITNLPVQPGTILTANIPPQGWPLLRDYLASLSGQEATDPRQVLLRAVYQIGAAASTAASQDALHFQEMFTAENPEMDALSQMAEPPDEQASEAEKKAYYEKYSAALQKFSLKYTKLMEEQMRNQMTNFATYAEMQKSDKKARAVVIVWLSARTNDMSLNENYAVPLPFALADDRTGRTEIEILP